ncbi:hypothetical protein B0H16DRAFT_1530365 [Mycena metata]|uniref:Glycan binding protein Y3-like domain-containing protein n=1 Tax=Mycena metata TaxID=1033252 RepID=A0AAD7NID4_9AGAR|nr:hypothetical protein B0H16DRAFT_1530365 [Mycena metata]
MLSTSLLRVATLVLLIVPTFGQNITCIPTGVTGDCSAFTKTFCGAFDQRAVAIGNSISACFATHVNDLKCDLTAVNTFTSATAPNVANCEDILSIVAAECPMGGSGQFPGGYTFTADPNSGVCEPTCGN